MNILVCDDDQAIVDAIEIYLSQEGYTVLKAYDGLEAIRMVKEQEIQLVLLDVMMPRMDGFTLTRKIKTDAILKDIPVVIHSSLSGNANEDHIRKVKADGYVAKFELNELSSVIEEVLERANKKIDGPLISRKQLA